MRASPWRWLATLFAVAHAWLPPTPGDRLRRVDAELLAVHPSGTADVALRWQSFRKTAASGDAVWSDPVRGTTADPIVAYEAQVSVAGSSRWTSLSTAISGVSAPATGARRRDLRERQRIFTRADAGQSITDGAFRLSLSFAGTSSLDMHQRVVTPPIPFNASEAALQAALESLDVVSRVQVFRSSLAAVTPGAYEWVVLFDPPASSVDDRGDLPLLALYSESISAAYSGAGAQVAVEGARDAQLEAVVCVDECQFIAEGLAMAGQTLSFRVRAQHQSQRWSDWSVASAPLSVPSIRVPSAPRAPELLAAPSNRLVVQWFGPQDPSVLTVQSFHLQQRCQGERAWLTVRRDVPPAALATAPTVAASLPLAANTTCEFRVAATNAHGDGPFSAPSSLFTTAMDAPDAPQALTVRRDPLRLTWRAPSDAQAFDVHIREAEASTWRVVPSSAIDVAARACALQNASLALLPFTRYVARVRSLNGVGASAFVESPAFLTEYQAPSPSPPSPLGSPSRAAVAQLRRATRQLAANRNDQFYVGGVGNGGLDRQNGEPGAVVVFPVTARGDRLPERSFFFSGAVESSVIERHEDPQQQIVALDVLAWGAGGGSAGKLQAKSTALANGGGGAFARGLFRVAAGDRVEIIVGGGGQGAANGGAGGFNGGGAGGNGGARGGGGGGASELRLNGATVLVAAGGGGGGATDYCCAHGGGGGGDSAAAESGVAPSATSIPLDNTLTGIRRDEYRSRFVLGDTRDLEGLPARHEHLDFGRAAASANYSTLATGGGGASLASGGPAGQGGSLAYSRDGQCFFSGPSPFCSIGDALPVSQATAGRRLQGGAGQDGYDAGGGGGGGFFGGGGGGAGVDGGGGGGGSSFVSLPHCVASSSQSRRSAAASPELSGPLIQRLTVQSPRSTALTLQWSAPAYGFDRPVDAFVVELANRSANEDFRVVRVLPASARNATIDGLRPAWWYRVRVKTLLRAGLGGGASASAVLSEVRTAQTRPRPENRWRRVVNDRAMQERETRAGLRFDDALPWRRRPSARRGHSLTALDGFLYLFGGFSDGYACNQAHKAACVVSRGVSNELWRLDPPTSTWLELSVVGPRPVAREKHSMAVVSNRLLLFGGATAAAARNDLWELTVSSTTGRTTASLRDLPASPLWIRDGREVFSIGNVAASPELCVADLQVTVRVTHACAQTLRLELYGPGPSTFPSRQQSARFPVDSQRQEATWSDAAGFGLGRQRTTPTRASARSFPVTLQRPEQAAPVGDGERLSSRCLAGSRTLMFASGSAAEPLSVFRQHVANGGWTLSVSDTAQDARDGTLDAWDIAFSLAPCVPAFSWRDVGPQTTGTPPSPRFQHAAVVVGSAMYVYGGRGDVLAPRELDDIYRLDYNATSGAAVWTALVRLSSRSALRQSRLFYTGRSLLLTPFELLALGLGLRVQTTRQEPHALTGSFQVARRRLTERPNGAAWSSVELAAGVPGPSGRYWTGVAFLAASNRVYLYGGQDDSTLLRDLWVLELDGLVEREAESWATRRQHNCDWRLETPALQQQWAASCGAGAAAVAAGSATECWLETLLLYAWCDQQFQPVS
ncbi:hypothetical protein P43SY_007378 [Pythium insidiosum]|uniref:Fibronectin type-III domain-containing protein n=1 Tax=Pythium insidiosum TaxID=114742 RepID=A0AAD5QBK8_PYTIN|nr:hypothetical protein P43SY_007378 [Pythium insidiosum]